MLEPLVGIGNVRAEVTADIDLERMVTNEEKYDPDGQVVRSTQAVTESNQSAEGQADNVSIGNELPDAGATNNNTTATRSERIEEATNYEITKTVSNIIKEAGTIDEISAAVVINGTEKVNEDGTIEYTPRTPEEMERYRLMVTSALGIDEARGDKVEIVNLQFATAPAVSMEGGLGEGILGFDPSQLQRLVEIVVLAVVGVLIILLVVRPLIAKVLEVTPQAMARAAPQPPPGMEGAPPMLSSEGAPPPMPGQLTGPGGMPGVPAASGMQAAQQQEESLIDIGQVEGRVRASSLRKVGEIIEKHPDEAVSIIRNWMYQEQ